MKELNEKPDRQAVQERFISRFIHKAPLTLLDVGVGCKTEWQTLAAKYPKMKVIGIEPLAALMPWYKTFNGEVHQLVLSGSKGLKNFYFDPESTLNASLIQHPNHTRSKLIPSMTLDEFDILCDHPKRILLWMDIEGSELKVLKSGKKLLASHRVRWINLEVRRAGYETPGWCTDEEINDLLDGFGYQRACEYNKHEGHMDVIYVSRHERRTI